jgi:hypothetical protein
MSRAFVREDRDEPEMRFTLPARRDRGFDAAAAFALIEAARVGMTSAAEEATGYRWGEARLQPHVQRLLDQEEALPEAQRDDRLIRLARRFLKSA